MIRLALRLAGLASLLLLAGCAALSPPAMTSSERLAMFPRTGVPVERPVTVRWNAFAVPFIEAETDRDAAFTLGLVHAHLRGGQLAVFRRVAQGRLSESAGPFTTDLDHALRLLGFTRAGPETERMLPPETRAWLEAFVAGLNHYESRPEWRRPPESGLLGLKREPWTVRDVLAIGRLAAADINWFVFFGALTESDRPDFAARWQRLMAGGEGAATIAAERLPPRLRELATLLSAVSKGGSNSVAIAAGRSATGGALLANDPHLGFSLPNFWLLAGVRSPSLHAVGMMVPGVPIIALGRNPALAWGGTNMRAASSDLYDVSSLPAAAIREERLTIARRFWFDAERVARFTPWGPIITDAAIVPNPGRRPLALRWTGQEPSDEITAFLRAARARDVAEFRSAFAGYAVSGQNLLAADTAGQIAKFFAVRLPARPTGWLATSPIRPLPATPAEDDWTHRVGSLELPFQGDPPAGFLVSANNEPAIATAVPLGFLFSPRERVLRLAELVAARAQVSVADLQALQRDVVSRESQRLAAGLLERIDRLGVAGAAPALVAQLRGWEGSYGEAELAPVAFELLLYQLKLAIPGVDSPADLSRIDQQWALTITLLLRDLDALPPAGQTDRLRTALARAARAMERFPTWGDMHRLRVQHLLGNLPLLGRRFRVADLPVGGSRETPMKTEHPLTDQRHSTSFGAQARHVSDLADPDANWFVLLGGQDGWLGSAHFADQLPTWREGRYLRLPLTPAAVAQEFPTVVILRP